ncbi:hypothetical protein BDZ89DRAFT_948294, partial [Hymenopellis radicata]
QKYERRQKIASVMLSTARTEEDHSNIEYWSFVLRAVVDLGVEGMSDEEDGPACAEPVKYTLSPTFRHFDFENLFDRVDETRSTEVTLFDQSGRGRLRRIRTAKTVTRDPTKPLPPSFFHPEYLNRLENDSPLLGQPDFEVSR